MGNLGPNMFNDFMADSDRYEIFSEDLGSVPIDLVRGSMVGPAFQSKVFINSLRNM